MKTKNTVLSYSKIYRKALQNARLDNVEQRISAYSKRLSEMYVSDLFKEHNIYPTMNVVLIYAVIAMCLELKEAGLSDPDIIDSINIGFSSRRRFFQNLIKFINLLPNSFEIAKKWNINDHGKRVKDGSITYDVFDVTKDKVEYSISRCMYVEMFEHYGIRSLCRIFCMTDERSYAGLTRHVEFIRHSDLSIGNCCHDEVIRRRD